MTATPQLGIFWIVADAAGLIHLLARSCPLHAAEHYGDCLTFPHGHADTWHAWRRHTLPLPVPALRSLVANTEYDHWPRGRIVYERLPARFVVYADRQLLTPARCARIIAACALKCLDGVIQARLWPQDDEERQRALDAGHVLDQTHVLTTDDLVSAEDCFFVATGITDGELMRGVHFRGGGATTHSLVMRGRSGTIRSITSEHQLAKLKTYASIDFEH